LSGIIYNCGMNTVVLLHGALGSEQEMEPLSGALREIGLNTHLFTFSGHGKKPFEGDFTIERFTNELDTFLSGLKDSAVHLAGYSMGGFVALNYAATRNFTGCIITHATKLRWERDLAYREAAKLDPGKLSSKAAPFVEKLKRYHGSAWDQNMRFTAGLLEDLGRNNYLGQEAVCAITGRVLMGLGDQDQLVGVDETVSFVRTLSRGAMYVLPETSHPIENADRSLLARLIKNFIERELPQDQQPVGVEFDKNK
jgi:pimeloyl-ACP methyl ester carboxylesterase